LQSQEAQKKSKKKKKKKGKKATGSEEEQDGEPEGHTLELEADLRGLDPEQPANQPGPAPDTSETSSHRDLS
jgi:hypothetical protein